MKKERRGGEERGISFEEKRSIAKAGMALSMGSLVYTGLRGEDSKTLHIVSGLALIGFSFWHYTLYQHRPKRLRPL